MAKPVPWAWAPRCGLAAASAGMPITCPEASTSAPQLLPGLIGALAWIDPGNAAADEPCTCAALTGQERATLDALLMIPPDRAVSELERWRTGPARASGRLTSAISRSEGPDPMPAQLANADAMDDVFDVRRT